MIVTWATWVRTIGAVAPPLSSRAARAARESALVLAAIFRLWLRSAWIISWAMTAAISESVLRRSRIPVVKKINPPGRQKALNASLLTRYSS